MSGNDGASSGAWGFGDWGKQLTNMDLLNEIKNTVQDATPSNRGMSATESELEACRRKIVSLEDTVRQLLRAEQSPGNSSSPNGLADSLMQKIAEGEQAMLRLQRESERKETEVKTMARSKLNAMRADSENIRKELAESEAKRAQAEEELAIVKSRGTGVQDQSSQVELNEQLLTAKKREADLHRNVAELRTKLADLESTEKTLKSSEAGLKIQCAKLESDNCALRSLAKEAEDKSVTLKQRLESESEKLRSDFAEVVEKLKGQQQDASVLDAERKHFAELDEELKKTKLAEDQARSEIEYLTHQINELRDRLSAPAAAGDQPDPGERLKNDNTRLRNELEDLKRKMVGISKNFDVTKNALTKLGHEKSDVAAALKNANEEIQNVQNLNQVLLDELTAVNSRLGDLGAENEKLQNLVTQREDQLTTLEKALESVQSSIQERSSSESTPVKASDKELTIRRELEQANKTIDSLTEKVGSMKNEINFLKSKESELSSMLNGIRRNENSLKSKNDQKEVELMENVASLTSRCDKQTAEIARLNEELVKLNRDHSLSIDEHKAAEVRLAALSEELDRTLKLLSERTTALQETEESLSLELAKSDDFKRKHDHLERDYANFKEKARAAVAQRDTAISQIQKETDDLKISLARHKSELLNMKSRKEESGSLPPSFNSEKTTQPYQNQGLDASKKLFYEGVISKLEMKVAELQTLLSSTEEKLEQLRAEAAQSRRTAESAQKAENVANELARSSLDKLENESASLKAKLVSLQKELRRQMIKEDKESNRDGEGSLGGASAAETLATDIQVSSAEVSGLRKELTKVRKQLQDAERAKETIGDLFSY